MEMHQVRYFLAVARVLNFTRAAEECHVAQPSLTRAIRQLEGELGGDLFRRDARTPSSRSSAAHAAAEAVLGER
jgi:DNA-binding transcriptional LysR family regulator